MDIIFEKITLEGMNELDRNFQRDPVTFADMSLFSEYRYSPEETKSGSSATARMTGGIFSSCSTAVRLAR